MKFRIILPMLALLTLFGACRQNDEPSPAPPEIPSVKDSSVLLYAVASNNLAYYFQQDLSELKSGLADCDLLRNEVFIYSVAHSSDEGATLTKAVPVPEGGVEFITVKEYDRADFSTSADRISEVIADYRQESEASNYGLILWSHATAWAPSPTSSRSVVSDDIASSSRSEAVGADGSEPHPCNADGSEPRPYGEEGGIGPIMPFTPTESGWWGQDINNGTYAYCDLPDLAQALPDHFFDYIWFDCCYMSSVEVIYELRDKAGLFVAYPTEVNAEGAPYDIVAPYIVRQDPDLLGAAQAMSDYYERGGKVYTMAIIDPSAITEVADICKTVADAEPASAGELMIYSRAGYYFYDFAQFMNSKAASATRSSWDQSAFDSAMQKLIIYKSCGDRLFTGHSIDKANYSGISTGYVSNREAVESSSDSAMRFYRTLEWYKYVYEAEADE